MSLISGYRIPRHEHDGNPRAIARAYTGRPGKIRSQLDAIDSAAPVSREKKRLIDERMTAYRQSPGSAISWTVAKEEIRKQIGS